MHVTDIINAIDSQDEALPRAALNQAMARPHHVTEPLLELIRQVVRDPEKTLDPKNNSIGYLIALYLLAQFREPRTYSLAVEALSLPGVDMDALFGDSLIEDIARILASVSDGDTWGVESLIENPRVDPRVRAAALEALVCLAFSGVRERREMVEILAEFFHGKLERQPSEVWTALVKSVSNIGPEELHGEVLKAHDEGLLAGQGLEILMDEVEDNRIYGIEMGAPCIVDCSVHNLVGNTLLEIGGWGLFSAETRLTMEEIDADW